MLISAFFPKLMEKLKHGSMLLRTEESVRFPGLGERTKRWRNYYLESQLMSTDSGDERKEPALEPGPRHLFHLSRKAHPAFRSERAEVPGIQASGMMPARHGTSSFYRFPPLLSPHHRYVHCSYRVYKDRGEGKKRDCFVFHRRQSSCSGLIYINIFHVYIFLCRGILETKSTTTTRYQ